LRDALDRAGGLDFVSRGDTVVLKVNTNSGDPYPFSTSPTAIRVIAGALVEAGARVIVGDRSFWGDDDTAGNLAANGIAAATRAAGAELLVFDDKIDWVEIDADRVPSWRPPFHLPRVVVEADHVINLAVAKTHFITGVTLGLKNMLGVVRAQDRARPGNLRVHHDELIHRQIADVNRVIAPRLTVIDGYRSLISGGPTRHDGEPSFADTRTIFAGKDRVALDVAAIRLLQRHAPADEAVHRTAPDEHPTIVAARAAKIT
jgi:uncharacterized protein (DUF362 family)